MGIVESGTTVILYNSTNHIIMVVTFGNNIEGAFTGGQSVEAIYTGSTKVWPEGSGPDPGEYYIKWWPKDAEGTFTMDGETRWLQAYSGYYVMSTSVIEMSAFKEISTINAIETNATEIKPLAFRSCHNLKYASMSQVLSLGSFYGLGSPQYKGPFDHCSSLYSVYLPKCKYLGMNTFFGCALTDVDLPECLALNGGVFANCYNLLYVSVPKCTRIDYDAFLNLGTFEGCSNLRDITLPVCSYIEDGAFRDCNLSEMTLGYSGVCSGAALGLYNQEYTSIFVPIEWLSDYKSTYPGRSSQFYPIPYSN